MKRASRSYPLVSGVVAGTLVAGCAPVPGTARDGGADGMAAADSDEDVPSASPFPLVTVTDVDLPGRATRFDYQAVDGAHGHLVIAHMGDSEVLVVSLADGATAARIPHVATVRGVAVAESIGRIFATAAATNELVIVDATSLTEVGRVATGRAPDGVAWDPARHTVAVSDQADGAVSLIPGDGTGTRVQISLGTETGNVAYDATRSRFWITVVRSGAVDQLVSVDPSAGAIVDRIDLPGCAGAHGLRLHPDGASAYVACESNATLVRVDLAPGHAITSAPVGGSPDVLAIDEARGYLYVAAESGDLTVFDLARTGLVDLDDEHLDATAHTVAVDPATHRVFFPLVRGSTGTPVLRIARPADV